MNIRTLEDGSAHIATGEELLHLDGPAAAVRQVLAAHFVRDCRHILEIGSHLRPVTPYLTNRPHSVLCVDPKTEPFEAEELNGSPCRVRHVNRKFQELEYTYDPRTYGLVLLGYSLKPFGRQESLNDLLFSLIDNAKTVVIEYAPELGRASSQVPHIVCRSSLSIFCSFAMELNDPAIAGSPYARRQFYVLKSAAEKT